MSRSELSLIEKTIHNRLASYFGEQDDLHFVLGVSGGMDSMTLLHCFHELSVSASVVHINYQKRGTASDKDAKLVADYAQQCGFDATVISVDPDEAEGQNFQQWARNRRYNLFKQVVEDQQAKGIAVAHHKGDQIETIMQKIFRGAGLVSWSGMQVWDGNLFRPLLDISRKEISAYVEQNNIPYRTDASNLQSDFARNFLRNEWFTGLSDFFPGWQKNVLRIGEQAHCFEQSLDWIADRIIDEKGMSRELFQSLDSALRKSLLLFLLKKRQPGIEISQHSLNQVEKLPDLQTGKSIQFTEELYVLRDRKCYRIIKEQQEHFAAHTLERSQLEGTPNAVGNLEYSVEAFEGLNANDILYLDAEAICWPITVRLWHHGDKIQPLGMQGHQLISDHLTNRKISAADKQQALVIESFEETICAVIFPPIKNRTSIGTISEHVKCDSDSKQCLKIRFSP